MDAGFKTRDLFGSPTAAHGDMVFIERATAVEMTAKRFAVIWCAFFFRVSHRSRAFIEELGF